MPTTTAFIGINQYRDPAISNLSGAKRDAVALEALFADTIPDLDARLLTAMVHVDLTVAQSLRNRRGADACCSDAGGLHRLGRRVRDSLRLPRGRDPGIGRNRSVIAVLPANLNV